MACVLFEQWQVIPHLLYNNPPLHPHPSSVWKVPLFSLPRPPFSPVCVASVRLGPYNVCGWRNGASVRPRGSSHTQLGGKGHTAWMPPSPSLFKHLFHSLHVYSARALRDTIVSLHSHAHRRTKSDGENKDWSGGYWVWFCVFSPPYACSLGLTRYFGSTFSWIASYSSAFRHHLLIPQHSSSKRMWLHHTSVLLQNGGDSNSQTCYKSFT